LHDRNADGSGPGARARILLVPRFVWLASSPTHITLPHFLHECVLWLRNWNPPIRWCGPRFGRARYPPSVRDSSRCRRRDRIRSRWPPYSAVLCALRGLYFLCHRRRALCVVRCFSISRRPAAAICSILHGNREPQQRRDAAKARCPGGWLGANRMGCSFSPCFHLRPLCNFFPAPGLRLTRR